MTPDPAIPATPVVVGNQRPQLVEALMAAFAGWVGFDDLCRAVGVDPSHIIGRNVNLTVAVDQLVSWCQSRSLIGKLVDAARGVNPNNELLAAVALDVKLGTALGLDGFRTPLLGGNSPILDREDLRVAVKNITATIGGSVLAVEGLPGSGKSYSGSFISHVVDHRTFRIASVDLMDLPATYHVGNLVSLIATQLGRGDAAKEIGAPPTNDQLPRWVVELTEWLIGQIRILVPVANLQKVWIVLDGFEAVRSKVLDQSFRDLAIRLAARAQLTPELVVILLDYPDPLPKIESLIHRDRIAAPAKKDIEHLYVEVIRKSGRPMDPLLLAALVDATWQEAEPNDPQDKAWVPRLGAAVKKRVLALLAGQ